MATSATPQAALEPRAPAAPAEPGAAPRPEALRPARRALLEPTRLKLIFIVVLTLGLLAWCLSTPMTMETMGLHELHRHFFFIPIALAAFWYGWRGGLVVSLVLSAAYITHMFGVHAEHMGGAMNAMLEFLTLLVTAVGSGWLVDRLRREERRLASANRQFAAQSEALRHTMETLTERTREVLETGEQLRRADRLSALGQLTAGLAHEIRNPLASIRGAAEILGDDELRPARRAEFSRVLLEEIDRLNLVLGNFLDYARAQRADGPAVTPLAPVAEKVLTLLAKPMARAQVAARTGIAADLPPLALAEGLLTQVLLNLALNAIQAMEARGGVLQIAASRDPHSGAIVLSVADNGPGIAPEKMSRVFDPFYTTKAQGTGLGLSIVHQIVTGQQGAIAVEDAAPGARFIVRLPAAE